MIYRLFVLIVLDVVVCLNFCNDTHVYTIVGEPSHRGHGVLEDCLQGASQWFASTLALYRGWDAKRRAPLVSQRDWWSAKHVWFVLPTTVVHLVPGFVSCCFASGSVTWNPQDMNMADKGTFQSIHYVVLQSSQAICQCYPGTSQKSNKQYSKMLHIVCFFFF